MAVNSYIKGVNGQAIYIGDYFTQRQKLDESKGLMVQTNLGARLYEIADYLLEIENDSDKAAQRLGFIHDQFCDGCTSRCKYCAIKYPGQNPWR